MKLRICSSLLIVLASLSLLGAEVPKRDLEADNKAAFAAIDKMKVGINMGNALDAPTEGAWGWKLEADDFRLVHEAGFQAIRLPVRWAAHAEGKAPYTISPDFFKRVDWALEQARLNQLSVVMDIHHFEPLMADPAAHREQLMALWEQIARHYAGYENWLLFEILNEPTEKLTDELWNEFLVEALAVIRKSNPNRVVVIGPGTWNCLGSLPKLKLPENDRLLAVTLHYYAPFQFTHQGAFWIKDAEKWQGKTWRGTPEEKAEIRKDFDQAAAWSKANRRPIYLGEFGANDKADMESRACWTRFIREEANARGMAVAYWEFCAYFGAYDRQAKTWRQPLLEALVGEKSKK